MISIVNSASTPLDITTTNDARIRPHSLTEMNAAAHRLVDLGYKVFPVNPTNGVRPKKWTTEYEPGAWEGDEEEPQSWGYTCDHAIVDQWWSLTWSCHENIGIVTHGLVIFDFDSGREQGPWTLDEIAFFLGISLSRLKTFPIAQTKSGGFHIYTRDPEFKFKSYTGFRFKDSKVDIRAMGGNVVAPPSWIPILPPDRKATDSAPRYTFIEECPLVPYADLPVIPEHLAEEVEIRIRPATHPPAPLSFIEFDHIKTVALFDDQEPISASARNDSLTRIAGLCRGCKGMDEDELRETLCQINDKRCSPPLELDEVERIVISVCKYAQEVKPHRGPDGLGFWEYMAYRFNNHCEEQWGRYYRFHPGEQRFYVYDDGYYIKSPARGGIRTDIHRWAGIYNFTGDEKSRFGEVAKKMPSPLQIEKLILPFLYTNLRLSESSIIDSAKTPLRLCKNGWLDLSPIDEGKDPILLPLTPAWFSRFAPMAAYDPEAAAPNWEPHLRASLHNSDLSPEENEELYHFALRGFSSILHPNFHTGTAGVLIGPSKTGKSTVLAGIQAANGPENSAQYTFQDLSRPFIRSDLPKYNSVVTSELPKSGFVAGDIANKLLTGEAVAAEIKGGESFTLRQKFYFLFAANQPPSMPNRDDAEIRRFWYVYFHNIVQFDAMKEDWKYPDTWVDSGEASGILNLLIAGAKDLRKNGNNTLAIPQFVADATRESIESENLELEFLKLDGPKFTGSREDFVTVADLHNRYSQFARRHNRTGVKSASLCRTVRQYHELPEGKDEKTTTREGRQVRIIRGLRWPASGRHGGM